MNVRQLTLDDEQAYAALRRESLLDTPHAFASSPGDDRAVDTLRRGGVVFGAFDGERLVGIVGIGRVLHLKSAHRAYVWGMYVTPPARGRGVAGALLAAAVAHARTWPGVEWVHLAVSAASPGARRVYERAGFVTWGREADALRIDGQAFDEDHMALRL